MIQLYNEDCLETLGRMEDNTIDLVVTSPPYNKNFWCHNKEQGSWKRLIKYDSYDDYMEQDKYEEWQRQILKELIRVIKPTGSIFYNHIDILYKHNTIHPKWVYDFPLKQVIIWDRKNTPKLNNTNFLPTTEWVFWLKKSWDDKPYFDRSQALHNKVIWQISRSKEKKHPAAFPHELVENIVKTCTKEGDTILDPFVGSGTTIDVAVTNNRNVIGIDVSENYITQIRNKYKFYSYNKTKLAQYV